MFKEPPRISIISTGYNKKHPLFKNANLVAGGSFCKSLNENTNVDNIGYGTALTSVLYGWSPGSSIFCLKVHDQYYPTTIENMELAIYEAIKLKSDIVVVPFIGNYSDRWQKLFLQAKSHSLVIVMNSHPNIINNAINVRYCGINKDIHIQDIETELVINKLDSLTRVAWLESDYIYLPLSTIVVAYISGVIASNFDKYDHNVGLQSIPFKDILQHR